MHDDLRNQLLTLTPKQAQAVQALADSSTHVQAAEAAGVERETVTRWANHHPAFKATLNQYRQAMHSEQLDTAQRLRTKALDVISDALDHGDRTAALAVIKLIDADGRSGPLDPAAILDSAAIHLEHSLPALALPRDASGFIDPIAQLTAPTSAERAATLVIERLATESGILDRGQTERNE